MQTYDIRVSVRTGTSAPFNEEFYNTKVQANSEREAKDIAESEALDDTSKKGVAGSVTSEAVSCVII